MIYVLGSKGQSLLCDALVNGRDTSPFLPNYQKPIEQVLQDTALFLISSGDKIERSRTIKRKEGFKWLRAAGLAKNSLTVPSWVPDWTPERLTMFDVDESGPNEGRKPAFGAAGDSVRSIKLGDGNSVITIEGAILESDCGGWTSR